MIAVRIALRYLLSRKSQGAVNIISAISLAAIAVASAAMIIVLSVFNGFEGLASSKLSAIDPDFRISSLQGKRIAGVDSLVRVIGNIAGVRCAAPQVREQAFAAGSGGQMGVRLMGMTAAGIEASGVPGIVLDGARELPNDSSALLSVGVAMGMNLRPGSIYDQFTLYEPRRTGAVNPALPQTAFTQAPLTVSGVFQVEQEEYDKDFIIVSYARACRLLNLEDEASSIDVYLQPGADSPEVEKHLREVCVGMKVADRYAQQEQAFRMIAVEKWITCLMLAFILVISSFSVISTLSMLILEKSGNMGILSAMGASGGLIDRIFISMGWMFVVAGGCAGLVVGSLLTLGQEHFGWIRLGGGDPSLMSIDVYPVHLEMADLGICLAILIGIALIITPLLRLLVRRSLIV